ncbi:MAG: PilZ domain-containing protein [Thermoanaerobaculia bacterium]
MSDLLAADRPNTRGAVRVARAIDFQYSADCPSIKARLEDISETGAFVDTTHSLTVGSQLDFTFRLPYPEDPSPIAGRGRVVWVQPMVGVGLEFQQLTDDDRQRLRYFVASVYFGPEGPASALA